MANDFISRVIELTNQERSRVGLSSLTPDSRLITSAASHSSDMALSDYFSHAGLNGSSPSDRAKNFGFSDGVAENIGAGYPSPEAVVAGWMNSPGHRANILNPDYKAIGVGYFLLENDTGTTNYNHYWTQLFSFSNGNGVIPSDSSSSDNSSLSTAPNVTDNNDLLIGSSNNDTLLGLGGNDTIFGDAGDDDLNGNTGSDIVNGEAGRDFVRGGQGNDTVYGGEGNDPHVNGNKENDLVFGGNGNDTVYGGQGDDTVFGEAGNDVLFGNLGADTLVGGAGVDVFILTRDTGTDTIADYNANDDFIGLAGGLSFGNLTITQGTGTDAGNVFILADSKLLAVLVGISTSQLDTNDFIIANV